MFFHLRWLGKIATFTVLFCGAIASASPRENAKDHTTKDHTTWSTYLGNADRSHYSALKQIGPVECKSIAGGLVLRQRKRTTLRVQSHRCRQDHVRAGEKYFDRGPGRGHGEPIVGLSLPAATWDRAVEGHRGINFWQSSDGSDKRLLISFGNNLEAINAVNGQLITSFGNGGTVNLKEGLGSGIRRRCARSSPVLPVSSLIT